MTWGVYGVPATVSTAGLWGGALKRKDGFSSHSPEDFKIIRQGAEPLFDHIAVLVPSAQAWPEPSGFSHG